MNNRLSNLYADILSLTERINQSQSRKEIQSIVLQRLQQYGIDHIFAGIVPLDQVSVDQQISGVLFGNWPEEWVKRYFRYGYLEHDPTIQHVRTSDDSLSWHKLPCKHSLVMNEATEFQLHDGITVPMLSIDAVKLGMSFAGEKVSKSPELKQLCYFISAISTARVIELNRKSIVYSRDNCRLTPKEYNCLQWVAEGKTNYEIGIILSVSERTIEKHISNLLVKTNSLNRTQLVANCLRNGLVN